MDQSSHDLYTVVVNHEEQYSLWPTGSACPDGWRPIGVSGDRERCLAWIAAAWTDQRPRSLRARLGAEDAT
ncbi:antibiotic synthesis protein MbtH [Nocardiopsis sp. CNR-923]|uniref:MbtH family protein n=1 Tax=Nocardiopsis sp. CNR-923 TaxID=1904965 RepID=UPI0009636CD1|nr:MbtH family NRPS accessory protein [Nocardiopsis sp. CNR-923]OLT24608.1 antibiotic synthesis protein MbtH [Nocardiopsis sp. CNR-923]